MDRAQRKWPGEEGAEEQGHITFSKGENKKGQWIPFFCLKGGE